MIEREVKLAFDDVAAARHAVVAAGGSLVVPRRLLADGLFDTANRLLGATGRALRVRRDRSRALLTFKGAVESGPVKAREEIETTVGSADVIESLIQALGFHRWFLAEKYREEYDVAGTSVAIDETPIGVFVEIEGAEAAIADVAGRLGRRDADYQTASYRDLHEAWCAAHNLPAGDMTFAAVLTPAPDDAMARRPS